jgi:hypothetical protein
MSEQNFPGGEEYSIIRIHPKDSLYGLKDLLIGKRVKIIDIFPSDVSYEGKKYYTGMLILLESIKGMNEENTYLTFNFGVIIERIE